MKDSNSSAALGQGVMAESPEPLTDREPASTLIFASAEYRHLRARLIALESLVTSLLSQSSQEQRDSARRNASLFLPQAGSTEHAITIDAVQQIQHLIDRAGKFTDGNDRGLPPR